MRRADLLPDFPPAEGRLTGCARFHPSVRSVRTVDSARPARPAALWRAAIWAELAVGLVALAPRLGYVLASKAGLSGGFGYDSGVYYAAADALVHGRAPYSDFVLLHPPGITLGLAPFAAFGALTTDHRGFVLATVACCVLGAVNAALVVRVARASGFGSGPAVAGGLLYAVWFGSVGAEYLIRLEPVGNFLVLCGLLAYTRSRTSPHGRWPLLCGAALGAAAAVKIWWAVPVVLVAAWFLATRRAQLCRYVLGAAAALVAICGPFFLIAPGAMWRMVVLDQLGRPRFPGLPTRLAGLTGLSWVAPHFTQQHRAAIIVVAGLVLVVGCVIAVRVRHGVLPVVLLATGIAVLLMAPSWYASYDDYLAPGLALSTSAAVAGIARGVRVELPAWLRWTARGGGTAILAGAVATAVAVAVLVPVDATFSYPSVRMAAAVEDSRCVMSDAPMPLILMDVLSRDLRNGCRDWVDVAGRTYGGADASPQLASGEYVPRAANPQWQHDLTDYLFSGDAITLIRRYYTGIGPELAQRLRRLGVLARADNEVVYSTRPIGPPDGDHDPT